jgi:ribose/xylose/arabinose/galactoside ABC-type transport system permease subunit
VPRLAAVLCMVVALITIIMLIFKDSDFSVGVSVALFPVVIMTMFIERMSNMWEEKGAKGALIAFIGTMVMACIVYLIAVNDYVKHAMITFPELLFVIFGCCLILGRYNGYRLTEYLRFRQLKKSLRQLQEKQANAKD